MLPIPSIKKGRDYSSSPISAAACGSLLDCNAACCRSLTSACRYSTMYILRQERDVGVGWVAGCAGAVAFSRSLSLHFSRHFGADKMLGVVLYRLLSRWLERRRRVPIRRLLSLLTASHSSTLAFPSSQYV